MHIKTIILLVTCISLLSACSANAETTEVANNTTSTNSSGFKFSPIAHANTADLLDFITSYENLEEKQQKATYLEVVQALAQDKQDSKLRIKHAAILSLPRSTLRDTKAAEEHFKALLADHSLSESNANLVKLLHIFTAEHLSELEKMRNVIKKVDALKQKNKALGRKLNDLKNIEKTMIERNAKTN